MGKAQGQQKKRGRKENDKRQRKRQKKQKKLQLPPRARPDQPATLEDLPLELLARIIRKMPFPQRLTAAGGEHQGSPIFSLTDTSFTEASPLLQSSVSRGLAACS